MISLQLILAALSGWLEREQRDVIEFSREENRRGAALSPTTSGLFAGLAAVSLANIEACVTRTHAFSVTVLLWHGVTSLMVIAVAVLASRRVLAWTGSVRA